MSDHIKVSNLLCITALAHAVAAKSKITINKDGLDAVVLVGYESAPGKVESVEVPLSLLDAAYVGMVRLWPTMKEVKDLVHTNQRTAREQAKAKAKADKDAETLKAKQEAKAKKDTEAKAKKEAKEKEKADRKAKREQEAKDRQAKKDAEAKAKQEAKDAEAKAKVEADAKKQKEDTAKAAAAAKKLSKQGKL